MIKRFDKKENLGITLIALVITIIVLLILAGITISQISNNGLFEKAKTAKKEYQNAQDDENDKIAKYANEIMYQGLSRDSKSTITKLWQYNPNATDANNGTVVGTITLNGDIDDYDAVRVSAQKYDDNGPYGFNSQIILKEEYYQTSYYGQDQYFAINMYDTNAVYFGFIKKE